MKRRQQHYMARVRREKEQQTLEELPNTSFASMDITQSTSRAPTDRSPSIELISEGTCAPSNQFGQSLANVKVERAESDRGYGYGEDDTEVPRRSRDDAQGQAKRRQTQPLSLTSAFDPGASLRARRRPGGRREQGSSRRHFRSTTTEM